MGRRNEQVAGPPVVGIDVPVDGNNTPFLPGGVATAQPGVYNFVGSGLGARMDLYERNYLASARTNRTIAHMSADRTVPYALVDEILAYASTS